MKINIKKLIKEEIEKQFSITKDIGNGYKVSVYDRGQFLAITLMDSKNNFIVLNKKNVIKMYNELKKLNILE